MVYNFRYPCCLCACSDNVADYTESAVYVPAYGPHSGKCIAGCASRSCGYFGAFIFLRSDIIAYPLFVVDMERMYSMDTLLLQRYPERSTSILKDLFA
jgi:hypothetical protein